MIDANGHETRWERDPAGRVLREVRADGVTDTDYTYDALGRLKTVTDPKQQVTTYTYNLDGSVASVVYTNAQIATRDPAYTRVATMVMGDMEKLQRRRFSLWITCAWACRSWVNDAKDMLKNDPTHDTNPHPTR